MSHFKESLCCKGKRKVVHLDHPVVTTDGDVNLVVILDISSSMIDIVASETKEEAPIFKPKSISPPSVSRLASAPSEPLVYHPAGLIPVRDFTGLPALNEEDEENEESTGLRAVSGGESTTVLGRQASVPVQPMRGLSVPATSLSYEFDESEPYFQSKSVSKMDVALDSLCKVVDYIVDSKKKVTITIYTFNSTLETYIDSSLISVDTRDDLKDKIKSIHPYGTTNLICVKEKIEGVLESCDEKTSLLVISDGYHTNNGKPIRNSDKLKEDRQQLMRDFTTDGNIMDTKNVQIFTVGIGNPGKPGDIYSTGLFDAELLDAMGNLSSGNTVETISNGIIGPCFNAISKIASNFKLKIKASKVVSILDFDSDGKYQVLSLPDVDYTQKIIFFVDTDEDEIEYKLSYFSEVDMSSVEKEGKFKFKAGFDKDFFDINVLLCRTLQKYCYGLKMKGDGKKGSLKKCLQVQFDILDFCSKDITSLELPKDHSHYFLVESYKKMIIRTKERFADILLRKSYSYSDSIILKNYLREASSGRPPDLSRLASDV